MNTEDLHVDGTPAYRSRRAALADGGGMIRVLIAEDVNLLRGALVSLLEFENDLQVVAAVGDGAQVVPAALDHRPDVALLDVGLPGMDGISAAALLKKEVPACRSLIVTGLGRPGTLHRALDADVPGYLLKDASPDKLVSAVRAVARGRGSTIPNWRSRRGAAGRTR